MTDFKYYTPQEVAEILGVKHQTILGYIRGGELGAVRLGRVYRVSHEQLDEFCERHSNWREEE